jgi:hypothetical protein
MSNKPVLASVLKRSVRSDLSLLSSTDFWGFCMVGKQIWRPAIAGRKKRSSKWPRWPRNKEAKNDTERKRDVEVCWKRRDSRLKAPSQAKLQIFTMSLVHIRYNLLHIWSNLPGVRLMGFSWADV